MKKEFTLAFLLFAMILGTALALAASHYGSVVKAEHANVPCPIVMSEVIASVQGNVYDMSTMPDYMEPKFQTLAEYTVVGNSITNPQYSPVPEPLKEVQANSALQEEAWQTFVGIIPAEDRVMVGEYVIFTDGVDNTLAAVDQSSEDTSQWTLDVDVADLINKDALLFTLIHEYAHILTLKDSQVYSNPEALLHWDDPAFLKEKAASCQTYFTGTGCSQPDSYIQSFYTRFWADLDAEWEKIDEMQYAAKGGDLTSYYDALFQFYNSHPDQFVDDYAVTHPTEDIAESFAYFVFSPMPKGTTNKEQKISFFYQYPELVQLRDEILKGVCASGQ